MSKRQAWGAGGVAELGEGIFRLRYRVNGKRYFQPVLQGQKVGRH